MSSLISQVADRQALLDDLNYLNMDEIKTFCDRHYISYKIWVGTSRGERRRTAEVDRKGILLERIRCYLKSGIVPEPTFFPLSVVRADIPSKDIKETDRIYYGQYSRKNLAMMELLKSLTNGKFKDGAIARILANEFWRNGKAPTCREYAAAWLQAQMTHAQPNPEWAFLSDRAAGKNTTDWKQLRVKKAKQVLRILKSIEPPP